jgi:hypothetical protein
MLLRNAATTKHMPRPKRHCEGPAAWQTHPGVSRSSMRLPSQQSMTALIVFVTAFELEDDLNDWSSCGMPCCRTQPNQRVTTAATATMQQ